MRFIKESLAAITIASSLLAGGLAPAANAAPQSAAIATFAPSQQQAKRSYVNSVLNGPSKSVVARTAFTFKSAQKMITVPVGSVVSVAYKSKTTSNLAINGKKYVAQATVPAIKKKLVSVPSGKATTTKSSVLYSASAKGKNLMKLKKGSKLTVYSFAQKGKTLVAYQGRRGWVNSSSLKAGIYTIRIATKDAELYTYAWGIMHDTGKYIKKGTKFTVLSNANYETRISSTATDFAMSSKGGVRFKDSKKIGTFNVKLTNSFSPVK